VRRDYELGFILHPEVSEERARTILERIEQIVTAHDGQVVRVNHWGRRRLAYPIEHNRDGIYVFVDMVVTPETLPELDRTLKVSEEVLRHLMKRRDPRVVQKEREAHAAAEAAHAAEAAQATQTAQAAEAASATEEERSSEPQEETVAAPGAGEATAAGEQATEAPEPEVVISEAEAPALSPDEIESAPPALDGHSVTEG
jgi:small subunit ribosomal protein S6